MTDTNPQDRIAELLAQRERLRKRLADAQERIEIAANDIERLEREKEVASTQASSLRSDIEVLTQHNEELTSQIYQGKAELNQRDFNRLDLIKDHDDLIRGKNKRIAELKAHAELREKRIADLRGVEDDLRDSIQEQAGEISDLKGRVASLDTMNANQAKTITDLQLAASDQEQRLKTHRHNAGVGYDTETNLKRENESLRTSNRTLEDQLSSAQSALSEAQAHLRKTEVRLTDSEDMLSKVRRQRDGLREQVNRITKVEDTGAPALDVDSKIEYRGEVLTVAKTTLYSARNGYRRLTIEADNTPPSNRQSEEG